MSLYNSLNLGAQGKQQEDYLCPFPSPLLDTSEMEPEGDSSTPV